MTFSSRLLLMSATLSVVTAWSSASANSEYHLIAKHSDRCFNIAGGGTSNKTKVVQWDCGGGDNDNFIFNDKGGGFFTISPVHARNMCLDIDWNLRTQNGVQLEIYQCTNGENQQFRLQDLGGGYSQIVSRTSNKCLDIRGGDGSAGAAVTQYDCKAGWDPTNGNQLFRRLLVKGGSSPASPARSQTVPGATRGEAVNVASQHGWHCLDVKFNGGAGSTLVTYWCHGGDNQRLQLMSDGTIRVKGLCLDVFDNHGQNMDRIGVWHCHGGANQKWRVTSAGEIRGINNRCLDVKNESPLPWGELILYDCTGRANQKWAALRVFTSASQQRTGQFNMQSGNQNLLAAALVGKSGGGLIANTGSEFTMPIGNNLTQVSPLANVTP